MLRAAHWSSVPAPSIGLGRLSDNHDKQVTPTDPRVQQAMVNLFADMGVQPGTLQSGLITGLPSTDHTAPTSTINALGAIDRREISSRFPAPPRTSVA